MGEIFKGEEPKEPTEEELRRMSFREFRKYEGGIEGKIRSEQDPIRQKELLNGLLNVEARRERRLAIPAMILTQAVLLKFDYPQWYFKEFLPRQDDDYRHDEFRVLGFSDVNRDTAEAESRMRARIETEREFMERVRTGELPTDWTRPIPYKIPSVIPEGIPEVDQADLFWGHCGRRLGHLIRFRMEGDVDSIPDHEKIIIMIDHISENFSEEGHGIEPYVTAEFGTSRKITREQIQEVADEIGFSDMVRGEE